MAIKYKVNAKKILCIIESKSSVPCSSKTANGLNSDPVQ